MDLNAEVNAAFQDLDSNASILAIVMNSSAIMLMDALHQLKSVPLDILDVIVQHRVYFLNLD